MSGRQRQLRSRDAGAIAARENRPGAASIWLPVNGPRWNTSGARPRVAARPCARRSLSIVPSARAIARAVCWAPAAAPSTCTPSHRRETRRRCPARQASRAISSKQFFPCDFIFWCTAAARAQNCQQLRLAHPVHGVRRYASPASSHGRFPGSYGVWCPRRVAHGRRL